MATISGGTAIAQALPILVTPVVTRQFTPDAFGVFGLYLAFITFATTAVTLGYSLAIVNGETDEEAVQITGVAAFATPVMTLLACGLLAGLIRNNSLGYGEMPYWAVLPMLLSLMITGVFFALRYLALRHNQLKDIAKATVAQSVGRGVVQVCAGFLTSGPAGLIASELMGRSVGVRRLWCANQHLFKRYREAIRPSSMWTAAKRHKRFPLLVLPSSLIDALGGSLPLPLLASGFGASQAGLYAIAYRITVAPVAILGQSVADVFYTRIARIAREEPHKAMSFTIRTAAGLFITGLIPSLVVLVWGGPLFGLVLGDTWRESGTLAATLVPWILGQLTVSPISRLVFVFGGQGYKLAYDILALLSILGSIQYGVRSDWSMLETVRLLGITQFCVYVVYLLLLMLIMRRWLRNHAGHGE